MEAEAEEFFTACEYDRFPLILVRRDLNAIKLKEHQGRHHCRPLVTVCERVILHDVEQVGGGHLEEIAVQVLSVHRRLGHGDGRLKQAGIADPGMPAVPLDLVAVNLSDLREGEEDWRQGLLGQPLESPGVSRVDVLESPAESPLTRGVARR